MSVFCGLYHAAGTGAIPVAHNTHTPNNHPQGEGIEGGRTDSHMVIGQEWDYELHDTMVYNTRYEETYWKGLCDQVGANEQCY